MDYGWEQRRDMDITELVSLNREFDREVWALIELPK